MGVVRIARFSLVYFGGQMKIAKWKIVLAILIVILVLVGKCYQFLYVMGRLK